jgi:hypothetical protein
MTSALREGTAPASVDFSKIPAVGMHLNDQWGCCTCAGDANIVQVQTYWGQGSEVVVPDQAVLQAYEAVGNFNPDDGPPGSNPTDNGAQIGDALRYLQNEGMCGHTIAGYGQIDTGAVEKIKTAISEFGCADFGVNLPKSAMTQFEQGADAGVTPVWEYDPAADNSIDGGHCVLAAGYTTTGFLIFTWSQVVLVTWAWWARFGGEAWTVISHDWVNSVTGKDPEGVDLAVLGKEFQDVTGQNPFPGVPPPSPPSPIPAPSPPPPGPAPPETSRCRSLFSRIGRWLKE